MCWEYTNAVPDVFVNRDSGTPRAGMNGPGSPVNRSWLVVRLPGGDQPPGRTRRSVVEKAGDGGAVVTLILSDGGYFTVDGFPEIDAPVFRRSVTCLAKIVDLFES